MALSRGFGDWGGVSVSPYGVCPEGEGYVRGYPLKSDACDVPTPPMDRMIDRHLRKHYPPTTSLVGGNAKSTATTYNSCHLTC